MRVRVIFVCLTFLSYLSYLISQSKSCSLRHGGMCLGLLAERGHRPAVAFFLLPQKRHPTSNGAGLYGWSKKTRFSAQLGHFAARPETSCLRQRAKILVGESSCLAPFQAENTSICAIFRAQNPKAKMSPGLPYNPVPLLAGPHEQINSAIQPQIADSGAISQLLFLKRGRSGP